MIATKGRPGIAGEIHADAMYTREEIQARLGLGAFALRQARRRGLPVRKIGRRTYILGRDMLAFAAAPGPGCPTTTDRHAPPGTQSIDRGNHLIATMVAGRAAEQEAKKSLETEVGVKLLWGNELQRHQEVENVQ